MSAWLTLFASSSPGGVQGEGNPTPRQKTSVGWDRTRSVPGSNTLGRFRRPRLDRSGLNRHSVRACTGAPPLCLNAKLNVAWQRQSDSEQHGHTWAHIEQGGYQWTSLGQNIAKCQGSVQEVFDASYDEVPPNDGHRQRIAQGRVHKDGIWLGHRSNVWTQYFSSINAEPCT